MDLSGLIVSFSEENQGAVESSKEALSATDFESSFSLEGAKQILDEKPILGTVVFADSMSNELQQYLEYYTQKVGFIPDSILIVNSAPSPQFMMALFEFGIEQFTTPSQWVEAFSSQQTDLKELLKDEDSATFINFELAKIIKMNDQKKLKEFSVKIKPLVSQDYAIAYAYALSLDVLGRYADSVVSFSQASSMNKMSRTAQSSHAQSLLLTGKTDESIEIFEKMEKSNPSNSERKSLLAFAYIDKGDLEGARKYISDAEAVSSSNRFEEVRVYMLIAENKIKEALELMDNLQDVGPLFTSKLNALGIKLSRNNKGKIAILLYKKAHKIVRPDLKYKISLNAALACRRLSDNETALKYIARCKKEYGGSFDKVERIERDIRTAMAKKS